MIGYNTSRVKACRPTGDDFSGLPSSSSSSSSSTRLSSCSSRAGFYNSEPYMHVTASAVSSHRHLTVTVHIFTDTLRALSYSIVGDAAYQISELLSF